MADKRYVVLEGQKYTGKHRVYVDGQEFPETELFGNAENIKMALEGAKDKMGKFKDGREFVSIKGKDPVIEVLKTKVAKK